MNRIIACTLAFLAIMLIIAIKYNAEWLAWLSIGIAGVVIINEWMYKKKV